MNRIAINAAITAGRAIGAANAAAAACANVAAIGGINGGNAIVNGAVVRLGSENEIG